MKKEALPDIPTVPGVYIFKDREGTPIYVGKSVNLNSRVKSYFNLHLLPKTKAMVDTAWSLSFCTVQSELEALLLESQLVKDYLPKYNIALKDDKSPLYIVVTKGEYPFVVLARKTELANYKGNIYGPFIDTRSVYFVLNTLRRIIPFCDHRVGTRPCMYSQLGLCNPCPNLINQTTGEEKLKLYNKYKNNIKQLKKALSGNLIFLDKQLSDEMKEHVKNNEFEAAAEARDKLFLITRFSEHPVSPETYLENPNFASDRRNDELKSLKTIVKKYVDIKKLKRIECFDIAHTGGSFCTASMVTFVDGDVAKKLYRHFKVKQTNKRSDVDSMREILIRRSNHFDDWGKPDLIIVDGGKPQLSVISKLNLGIPVISLAKQFETLVFLTPEGFVEYRLPDIPAKFLVTRIRDESHRFARRLHHKLIKDSLIGKPKH